MTVCVASRGMVLYRSCIVRAYKSTIPSFILAVADLLWLQQNHWHQHQKDPPWKGLSWQQDGGNNAQRWQMLGKWHVCSDTQSLSQLLMLFVSTSLSRFAATYFSSLILHLCYRKSSSRVLRTPFHSCHSSTATSDWPQTRATTSVKTSLLQAYWRVSKTTVTAQSCKSRWWKQFPAVLSTRTCLRHFVFHL